MAAGPVRAHQHDAAARRRGEGSRCTFQHPSALHACEGCGEAFINMRPVRSDTYRIRPSLRAASPAPAFVSRASPSRQPNVRDRLEATALQRLSGRKKKKKERATRRLSKEAASDRFSGAPMMGPGFAAPDSAPGAAPSLACPGLQQRMQDAIRRRRCPRPS